MVVADDPAVRAVDARRRAGEAISYGRLRSRYGKQNNMKDELEHGVAVLQTLEQLDQYLWTYGPMVCSQWHHATKKMPSITRPVRIVDHGCGQGLAGLLLHDLRGAGLFDLVRDVILVEPSPLALARATSVYRHIASKSGLTAFCTGFDELKEADLRSEGGLDHLHLFSNTLDIDTFDAVALMAKALQPGRNIVLAVSPDRDFAGGTPQLIDLKARMGTSGCEANLMW